MARKSGVAMARQSQQVLRSASSSSQPSFQFFPNPGFFNPHRTISAAHSISFHLQTLLQFPPSLPKPSLSPTPTSFLALRFISPIIGELSEQYPHVTTYKVDIDEKCLTNTLDELNISSVPTFQFFKDGKTVAEVVGANVAHLRNTLKNASRISEDD
ncbi:unnamed protein product [Malus baccata var. baccata]